MIVVHYACAAPVRMLLLRDDLFAALGRDHHTIDQDRMARRIRSKLSSNLIGRRRELSLPDGAASVRGRKFGCERRAWHSSCSASNTYSSALTTFSSCFVLSCAAGQSKSLLLIVTAFTIAHSITLGARTLDVVRPPTRLIEPLIALSIAYVAFENIFTKHSPSRRWLASFLFGFVHGFGFAGALVELGLTGAAPCSRRLLFFNLGVEAGQAMIVAVLFPALLWLSRLPGERRAVTFISAAVLTTALALFAQRALEG